MESEETAETEDLVQTAAAQIPKHNYVPADPRFFTHLDLKYYDKAQRILETQGFRLIGDVENLTHSALPRAVKILSRLMVNEDGTLWATIYHYRPRFFFRVVLWLGGIRSGKVVDFETAFSNAHFMTTSNHGPAGVSKSAPELHTEELAPKTPVLEVLARHRQRVEEYLGGNPGVFAVPKRTLADIVASKCQRDHLSEADSLAILGVSYDELLEAARGDTEAADRVFEKARCKRNSGGE